MQQFTSTLSLDCQDWRYLKATAKPDKKNTSSNLRANLRRSRAVLNTASSLLALPIEGEVFSDDSSSFFLLYHKKHDLRELQRVLKQINSTEEWRPSDSEQETGVPFTLFQEAVKFAIVHQLNRRGWARIGQYLVKINTSWGQIPAPMLSAVKLHCWLNHTNAVCFSPEGAICKLNPVQWDSLSSHYFMVKGKVALQPGSADLIGGEDLATLKCYCLPSLKDAVVVSMSKSPPPLPVSHKEDKDYHEYWSEVHGYSLPSRVEGYITVSFGPLRRTYPSCCLCSHDLTILVSQSKLKGDEIVRALLLELADVLVGGKPLGLSASVPQPIDVSWQNLSSFASTTASKPATKPATQPAKGSLIVPKFPKKTATSAGSMGQREEPLKSPVILAQEGRAATRPTQLLVPQFSRSRTVSPPASPKAASANPPDEVSSTPSLPPPSTSAKNINGTPVTKAGASKVSGKPMAPPATTGNLNSSQPSPKTPGVAGKRKRPTETETPPGGEKSSKAPKTQRATKQTKEAINITNIDFKKHVAGNSLGSLSVPILQAYCREKKVGRIPRKKDDLIKAVTAHVNSAQVK